MIERCHLCRKVHETGGDVSYFGMKLRECPELDEGTIVPLENRPVRIELPYGGHIEFDNYVIAGMPIVNAR